MLTLSSRDGKPVLEIEDHKGRPWLYRYRVKAGKVAWVSILTALDPETGEPAVDGQGEPRAYAVILTPHGRWCQCRDFLCRKAALGERCKHLIAAEELRRHLSALLGDMAG